MLARAAFGVRGAALPSLLRGLIACGWFGIQTWVGAGAIHTLLSPLWGGGIAAPLPWLGIAASELACFAAFWAAQVAIIVRGIESIRVVEAYSAPLLILLSALLLCWAISVAGSGLPAALLAPGTFVGAKKALFWKAALPAVTANVGFWATLSLNIPDFSRYALSQRAQVLGQVLGLPLTMVAFSATALVVTAATASLYGAPIADPVAVISRIGGAGGTAAGLVGLIVATLSTNIAANVVAPANAFVNLSPARFSFRSGGLLTAALGALLCPWRLIGSTDGFIFVWLVGGSALLGPVCGVLLADYYILRKRRLDVDGLYSSAPESPYHYRAGVNPAAFAAVAAGIAPNVPGFLGAAGLCACHPLWAAVYDYAWFVGAAIASALYLALMRHGAATETST